MASIIVNSFDALDQTSTPPGVQAQVVQLGGSTLNRVTYQPGWRWSMDIKPVAGTDWCEKRHVGTVLSGTARIRHQDGTELEAGVGDAYVIEPGHDGWVVGEVPLIVLEFEET